MDLAPSSSAGEFLARNGQRTLYLKRFRMRGAEDSPSPLDHVLHDGLGFDQVVACVEIETGRAAVASTIQTRVVADAIGIVGQGRG